MIYSSNLKFWINLCIVWAIAAHLLFLGSEIFLWQTPFVQEKLLGGFSIEQKTKILAHTMGLYNGFLSTDALWDY